MKTIFFDLGGVILSNGWDHRERGLAAAKFGWDAAEIERRHAPLTEPLETGALGFDEYLGQLLPTGADRAAVWAFAQSCSAALPESLALLAELAGAGKARLAALNNESRELNAYRIERFGLGRYFSAFCSSCYLGARKPGAEIYRRALGVLHASAGECLFVDDRAENLAAPAALGMATVQFRSTAELRAVCLERSLL